MQPWPASILISTRGPTKAANGTARSSSPRAPGSAAAAAAGSAAAESGESTKPGNGKGDMPRPLVPPGVGGSRLIHVALQLHCPRLCGWPGASHVNKPTGPGSLSGVPLFFCIPWGQHRPRRAPFALRAYSGRVRHSERGRSTQATRLRVESTRVSRKRTRATRL